MGQSFQEQDGVCDSGGCYSIHLGRKSFRESWRICKDKGGNLATIKTPEEASLIHELLLSGDRSGPRPRIRLWIGLQRQPRQCSATRPLRGFTWITGDQETLYTNWQREDLPSSCTAHRCVVISYNTADRSGSDQNNFKWLDGSCTVVVDGFLCRYTYQGMCPTLKNEGGGPAIYTTPFELESTVLAHVPFGSVANLPCPDGTKEDQSVLCMARDDGSIGWSKDAPLCSDAPKDLCEEDNGGCEQDCVNLDTHYYCECTENYVLGDDGKTCQLSDPCQTANCEFECEATPLGHQCKCPDGYLLSGDGQSCFDIDECLQTPCPQECSNAPGTFECRCKEGFITSEFGECLDVDECMEGKCDHLCENSLGSYTCRCHEGFSPLADNPDQCEDIDECNTPDNCDQLCKNYEGGFECLCEEGYKLQEDLYYCRSVEEEKHSMVKSSESILDDVPDNSNIEWSTNTPTVKGYPTYHWLMEKTTEKDATTEKPELIQHGKSGSSNEEHSYGDETAVAAGNTVDIKTSGDKISLNAFTSAPKNNRNVIMPSPVASQLPDKTLLSERERRPGDRKKHDKSWLLVALLVPLCVFIVVMLALGIVYCTSCAVEPWSKSVTDCYRWATTSKDNKSKAAKSRA
ncbi:hypothetical protein DNTS_023506 [Danionella cerebrum]|uniref:Uncharacterized protein n=1 Tax=Danionella cerebrum TaxID=2873325 RepID=A0A553MWM3_9TELE|nr:hypothetical protein DNTS_023506 [Danionella translucida]